MPSKETKTPKWHEHRKLFYGFSWIPAIRANLAEIGSTFSPPLDDQDVVGLVVVRLHFQILQRLQKPGSSLTTEARGAAETLALDMTWRALGAERLKADDLPVPAGTQAELASWYRSWVEREFTPLAEVAKPKDPRRELLWSASHRIVDAFLGDQKQLIGDVRSGLRSARNNLGEPAYDEDEDDARNAIAEYFDHSTAPPRGLYFIDRNGRIRISKLAIRDKRLSREHKDAQLQQVEDGHEVATGVEDTQAVLDQVVLAEAKDRFHDWLDAAELQAADPLDLQLIEDLRSAMTLGTKVNVAAVARACGCPETTARSRWQKLRQRLRKVVPGLIREPET